MFDLLYTVAPIEYFVNGKLSKGFLNPKHQAIYSGSESLFRFKTRMNDQVGIMAAWYPDENISGSKQGSFISFYENQDYMRFMACAPVEYYYHKGSKSERKPAYEWQLERSQQRMDPAEYDHWKCYFESLESENKNNGILPDGFTLEAVTHRNTYWDKLCGSASLTDLILVVEFFKGSIFTSTAERLAKSIVASPFRKQRVFESDAPVFLLSKFSESFLE